MIGSGNLQDILVALDRQIGIHAGFPIGLVVCGGTALAALGLVSRTTKDVDVLAQAEPSAEGSTRPWAPIPWEAVFGRPGRFADRNRAKEKG